MIHLNGFFSAFTEYTLKVKEHLKVNINSKLVKQKAMLLGKTKRPCHGNGAGIKLLGFIGQTIITA